MSSPIVHIILLQDKKTIAMSAPPIVLLSDRRIKHYAGSVTYSVEGFVAKNSDLLERDLSAVIIRSQYH